jgi:hypothetical protein
MALARLLVAGPVVLDALAGQDDVLGGEGFYAAAAAAACVPTRLWARAGVDFVPGLRRHLQQRRIALEDLGAEGPTLRCAPGRAPEALPRLPAADPGPTPIEAALLIGLPTAEAARAAAWLRARPGGPPSLVVAALRPAVASDPALLDLVGGLAQVLILSAASARVLTGRSDPLAAARALQERGPEVVLLTAGALGGLIAYQQRCATWPAAPRVAKDPTGTGSIFAGALTGLLAEHGGLDWEAIKRCAATAGAVAAESLGGIGPKRLLALDRDEYTKLFHHLRRHTRA